MSYIAIGTVVKGSGAAGAGINSGKGTDSDPWGGANGASQSDLTNLVGAGVGFAPPPGSFWMQRASTFSPNLMVQQAFPGGQVRLYMIGKNPDDRSFDGFYKFQMEGTKNGLNLDAGLTIADVQAWYDEAVKNGQAIYAAAHPVIAKTTATATKTGTLTGKLKTSPPFTVVNPFIPDTSSLSSLLDAASPLEKVLLGLGLAGTGLAIYKLFKRKGG